METAKHSIPVVRMVGFSLQKKTATDPKQPFLKLLLINGNSQKIRILGVDARKK
jgi:hypothetical protein